MSIKDSRHKLRTRKGGRNLPFLHFMAKFYSPLGRRHGRKHGTKAFKRYYFPFLQWIESKIDMDFVYKKIKEITINDPGHDDKITLDEICKYLEHQFGGSWSVEVGFGDSMLNKLLNVLRKHPYKYIVHKDTRNTSNTELNVIIHITLNEIFVGGYDYETGYSTKLIFKNKNWQMSNKKQFIIANRDKF